MSFDVLKVSVIIPVYNVEKFIANAIQSVLAQECSDYELILVNDGSTDRSLEICEVYAQQEGVRLLEQENRGVSAARNLGLQYAVGEYVFFLDADDTIDSNFLLSSYQVARDGAYDLVVLGEPYGSRLPCPPALPTCAQFWRLAFLRAYPEIRFPEGVQPCEDGLFSHQLVALTDRIGFNAKAQYFYRQHEGQNHRLILSRAGTVLAQIPTWLGVLADFYTRMDLWDRKALHLARFVQHEPFELRYLAMPLSDVQKSGLFDLIHGFFRKHSHGVLGPSDWRQLSPSFRKFLACKDHREFDDWLAQELNRIERKRKRQLFLVKFIPIARWRRMRRGGIHQYFDERIRSLKPL